MNLQDRIKKIKLVAFDLMACLLTTQCNVDEDGKESVRCWRGDGLGCVNWRSWDQTVVISSESNPW